MNHDIANLVKLNGRDVVVIWEIIGAYFVNRVYNQYYSIAIQQYNNGSYTSVTDAYMSIVSSYVKWFEVSENSRTEIENIVDFYNNHKGTMLLFADFEDVFVKTIVPKEYISYCSDRHKDNILYNALHDTLVEFITAVCKSRRLVKNIVDDHSNQANIRELQDLYISIMADHKHGTYAKISTAASSQQGSSNDNTEKYTSLIKNLRKMLDECNIKISELQAEADASKRVIKVLATNTKELTKKVTQQEELIKQLQSRQQPPQIQSPTLNKIASFSKYVQSPPEPQQRALPAIATKVTFKSSSSDSDSDSGTTTDSESRTSTNVTSLSTSSSASSESITAPPIKPVIPIPVVTQASSDSDKAPMDPTNHDYWGDDY